MKRKKSELERSNLRYNMLSAGIYVVGIILLVQLFNLQIVRGATYREESNTRLSRESTIQAARGGIKDRTGTVLASSEMGFSLELFKTKVDDDTLNSALLTIVTILEENGDKYVNTFPISINPFTYNFETDEELNAWKTKYKIPEAASAEEAFYIFKDKYKIKYEDPNQIRKVLAIRYATTTIGYSTTKSIEISSDLSRESIIKLSELSGNLAGINIIVEPVRKYYMGNLGSHIIGYIGRITEEKLNASKDYKYKNDAYVGISGIEGVFEEYLRGKDGKKQIDMSVTGETTGEYTVEEAIGGSDIILTIDANLQSITEQALAENIQKIRDGGFGKVYDAQGGSAVVMNVKTGEILAMASAPDFNPQEFVGGISTSKWNEYRDSNALFNKSIQGTYAPGSLFKMVTAIAGLETGEITPDERINDTGKYPFANEPECWYYTSYHVGHGWLNVSQAIQKSCNYFFYETGMRLGIDRLSSYADFFGLGRKTGVELLGESAGTLAGEEAAKKANWSWYDADILYASIGQSYNDFTPLQVAKYISMVANGGHKINPTIIKNVIDSSGNQVPRAEIEQFIKQKLNLPDDTSPDYEISQDTINAVLSGMRAATEDVGGTAYSVFKDFAIDVGGKTGSAEAGAWVNAWFAGFAPFDDPEIAVVVLVENGGHGYYTGEVVRKIIEEYFGMNVQSVVEDMSASYETESLR